ncbi:MAG TPA: hypothetical protein VF604_15540 [Pyrinomonadaceae bacterium]|jgi:hypothetical protein
MSEKIQNLLKEAETSDDGKSSITGAEREFAAAEETAEAFDLFSQKLYDINRWEAESGVSAFQLFDENGKGLETKKAQKGNFVRISLPGSGKHDWVKIVDIHDAPDEIVITVQPTYDPTEKETDKDTTSHFFTSEATNNFCLQKREKSLAAYVIGLHEKPNTSESGGVIETVRNAAAASFGWLGFQKIEWKTFCENFLESEKVKK